MSYAIRKDGSGWRSVSGQDEVNSDETFSETPPAIQITLDDIKLALRGEVDADAERERQKYITPGAGQAMTYTEKRDQAKAYLAATAPVDADYPLLSNEVGITASTIAGVAQAVMDAYALWLGVGASIEKIRMEANKAIADAVDEAAARQARAEITWP